LRILFAHNRYLFRGGEDESRDQEISMLRSRGHEVIEYLVDNHNISNANIVSIGVRSIWNGDQFKKMKHLLREARADILKVDNYFPLLSPSIFDAAKSAGVPSILSVRNYRLICPSANLFREGRICKDCVSSKLAVSGIVHRCYRRSYLQSTSVALSTAYASARGTWSRSVDHYIAISETVKKLLVEGGFPVNKISVKPNTVSDTGAGDGAGNYAIFVGRLTEEKGIMTLLSAWRKLGSRIPLKIIGTGPLENVVEKAASEMPAIEFLRQKSLADVCDYVGKASMLIFSSEWLEPFGRAVVEAFSKGTPVVAADTEPMRDMIDHEHTGLLYKAGDSIDLAAKVASLLGHPEKLSYMRERARKRYLEAYSEESTYDRMIEIFRGVSAKG
jgi:glycosyltransferase involved in cell wall biosynthesis